MTLWWHHMKTFTTLLVMINCDKYVEVNFWSNCSISMVTISMIESRKRYLTIIYLRIRYIPFSEIKSWVEPCYSGLIFCNDKKFSETEYLMKQISFLPLKEPLKPTELLSNI